MDRLLTGGCACGAVRYATAQAPMFQNHCQCRDCQHRSGGGHASWLTFADRSAMVVEGGADIGEWAVAGDSGQRKTHGFCRRCGAPVFLRFAGMPALVAVPAGSLDDPDCFAPQVVTYAARAPAWDHLDPALPAFAGMPTA